MKNIKQISMKKSKYLTLFIAIFAVISFSLGLVTGDNNYHNCGSFDKNGPDLWNCTILFTATDYGSDDVIFGEDTTATDGYPDGPELTLDAPNPSSPPLPYIDAYFMADYPLTNPYYRMRNDIKNGPASNKIWDLYVKLDPDVGYTVNMNWNIAELDASEYDYIELYDGTGTTLLADMLTTGSYEYVSPASVTQQFKIVCASSFNDPPNSPNEPSGEIYGYHGISYTYSTSTIDPDNDNVCYGWDWGGNGIVDEWTGFYSSGTTVNTAHIWESPGEYYIGVKAKDESEAESDWSNYILIDMSNRPPNQPSDPSPGNGSNDVGYNLVLNWTGNDPDVGDIVTYDIYFGTNISPPKVISRQSENYLIRTLLTNTTYYWKIVAWDNFDASTSGLLWTFTTGSVTNEQPDKPSINGPVSGKIGTEYEYTFVLSDPDGDDIYLYIEWGDGSIDEWIGSYRSGKEVKLNHTWDEKGTYNISAKTKDIHDAESDWATLEVSMPKTRSIDSVLFRFIRNLIRLIFQNIY